MAGCFLVSLERTGSGYPPALVAPALNGIHDANGLRTTRSPTSASLWTCNTASSMTTFLTSGALLFRRLEHPRAAVPLHYYTAARSPAGTSLLVGEVEDRAVRAPAQRFTVSQFTDGQPPFTFASTDRSQVESTGLENVEGEVVGSSAVSE